MQHSNLSYEQEAEFLQVKESQIPNAGKGLFLYVEKKKGEVVALFRGEVLSYEKAEQRALKNEEGYFINMSNGTILDSMHVECFAKYANDAHGLGKSKFKSNAEIQLSGNPDIVYLVAMRDIKAGEEIFTSYGRKYWNNFKSKMKAVE
ncbi:MAG: hypothetical protein JWM14_2258 [Chitinophagaceae bacterium]|nr:hypothetical protein [Chitinophagaceae bacterium]